MNTLFANNIQIPSWKIRKGTVVMFYDELYHVQGFCSNGDIVLRNYVHNQCTYKVCCTEHVEWLEEA